ncbi:transposable element Tcb2 transposase [Trichonephila clavipes]|nr:transposable element Tcb2 transposase [Trichonephila clavipes]
MNPAYQVGTVQGHGDSMMARGVFLWHCLVSLVHVPTSLNAIPYVELLGITSNHLCCSVIHTKPRLKSYLTYLRCFGRGVKGHHTSSTNLTELWTTLANIWQAIPMERFQKLIEFMPRRVVVVIKTRGGQLSRYPKFSGTSVYICK